MINSSSLTRTPPSDVHHIFLSTFRSWRPPHIYPPFSIAFLMFLLHQMVNMNFAVIPFGVVGIGGLLEHRKATSISKA
jgi:hypothetical protein